MRSAPGSGWFIASGLHNLQGCWRSPLAPFAPALQEGGDDTADGEVQDPASFSSFYGHWQTVEYEPPAAKDGIVPKNERGNVEVPPLNKLMPRGTVRGKGCWRAGALCTVGTKRAPP